MKARALLLLLLVVLAAGAAIAQGPDPAAAASAARGWAPLSGNQRVPKKWLPPGAEEDDRGPSAVIFPPQSITIRFDHEVHVKLGRACASCHPGAVTSNAVSDRLLPPGTTCDGCHLSDHSNPAKVTPGPDVGGKCATCHVGWKDGDGNKVAPMVMPRANMVFAHGKHAARNIGCGQCHGSVEKLELATRDQLPRMKGCFGCHQMPDPLARGDAKGACDTCHVRGAGSEAGTIRTMFPQGTLSPPRWLHDAFHGPDFVARHKRVAGADSAFCASCHKEDFCTACHDGRVRPRSIHPGDYLSMHATEARLATQRCQSCHSEQSFCLGCHQRAGVSMSGPAQTREAGRFHPPRAVWSDGPRTMMHHASEAQRNLAACVSCHVERDCAICHGSRAVGGAGFTPHGGGFVGQCGVQMRRNPRPCFVCHDPSDAVLGQCR